MILSEDDVRAYVREASGGKARWVEPALGSTPGLPDCWVPFGDRQVHLELKCGQIKNGLLRFEVRPEQRREIIAMREDRVKVGLLIGVKNTERLIFAKPITSVLGGSFSLVDLAGDVFDGLAGHKSDLWRGVNFIFSDFA